MKLYFKYVLLLFKSQMQYRASFWLLALGQCITPITVFLGVYFMFERFGRLGDWTFHEAALCFVVTHTAFSLSECFARGFDLFSTQVVNGDFDRLLVRPRSTVLQVFGSRLEFARLGRLMLCVAILIWTVNGLGVDWTMLKLVTLLLMVASGTVIFTGILIVTAAISFWTTEGLEATHIFTDGGREMAQYPLNIYSKWLARFFTFVIPFGCFNYLPLLYITGRAEGNGWVYMLTPLAGFAFILPCLLFWRIGVRHYRSTGS